MSYEQDLKNLAVIEKKIALFDELVEGIERAIRDTEKEVLNICKHAELDQEETNKIFLHNKELKYYNGLLDKVKAIEEL